MNGILDYEHCALVAQNLINNSDRVMLVELDSIAERSRPSALFRPRLSIDGDQWCALYGDNLQDGVAGFGNSPADAMADFDRAWKAPPPLALARARA